MSSLEPGVGPAFDGRADQFAHGNGPEAQMHRQIGNTFHCREIAPCAVMIDTPGAEILPQAPGARHAGNDAEGRQIGRFEAELGEAGNAAKAAAGKAAIAGAGDPVCCGQPLQPGIFVRREYRKRTTGLCHDLRAVENRLILEIVEGNAGRGKFCGDLGIALFGGRFVIAVGKYRRNAEFARKRRNLIAGGSMANDQPATAPAQCRVEFEQRLVDEMYPAIVFCRQRIKNSRIENKGAKNLTCLGKRRAQGGVVVIAEVAAKPDEGFFLWHGWFVPCRRLKFHS